MKIAEMFVDIGLKGGEMMGKSLGNIRNVLSDVSSLSWQTKAGILAAVYGMQHFMSSAASQGTDLRNFSILTNESTDALQRWQLAAESSGVSAEQMTGAFSHMMSAMAQMKYEGNTNRWFGGLAKFAGELDKDKINSPLYMIKKLRTLAQNQKVPVALANEILHAFGMSDGMISFLRNPKMTPESVPNNLILSRKENNQLSDVYKDWSLVSKKMEMSFSHLTAKHGPATVKSISEVTDSVVKLLDELGSLSEKLKIIQLIGLSFEGWANNFQWIAFGIDKLGGYIEGKEKDIKVDIKKFNEWLKDNDLPAKSLMDNLGGKGRNPSSILDDPDGDEELMMNTPTSQNIINQNLNITHYGDASDTDAVVKEHKTAALQVKQAFRQFDSNQVN